MSKRPPNKSTNERAVLGVSVGTDTIHAVLVRKQGGQPKVVARFLRQRVMQSQLAGVESVASAIPGMKKAGDSDYVLEFGDGSGSGGSDISTADLAALKGATGAKKEAAAGKGAGTPVVSGPPIAPQLREILQECLTLGFRHPAVTFCLTPPSVSYTVLDSPAGDAAKPADRKGLLDQLQKERDGVKTDRVAFLPLAAQQGRQRVMAVVAEPGEPVADALRVIREEHEALTPSESFVDAEAAVLAHLVEHGMKPVEGERTAFVRVGTEDTAVFFFEGDRLLATERLRSVSAYDSPDIVCSRVLLQQDTLRVGDLSTIVLMTTGRQEALLSAFRQRFPDATVEDAHKVMEDIGVEMDAEADAYKAGVTTALASALRLLQEWNISVETNLLPQRLQKKVRTGFRITWHNVAALVLLLVITGFHVMRYQDKAATVEEMRHEMLVNPPPAPLMNPAILQARVDSLNAVHANYTRALNVLDSLLVGSDKWISTMERLSRSTTAVSRTWIDDIQPQSNTALRVSGRSLTRLAVVDLARRLEGAIQQLTYQDVGQQRVYSFQMIIPTPLELPRAAMYLRSEKPDAEPQGPVEVHPAQHTH